MNNAMQTIWHQGYERALKTITSLRNHCDFKYERDTKNARKVIILNADKPTIRTYVPGTPITRDAATSTKQEFELDQMKYFNVGIDHVVKAQTVPGALEAICEEGAIALTEEGDKYVAKLVADGVNAESVEVIDGTSVTKANAVDKIEEGFAVLYGNDCKVNAGYFGEFHPSYFTKVRPNLIEIYTDNVQMAKKGFVGKYGNAMISVENLLPKDNPTYAKTSDAAIIEGKTYYTQSGSAGAYVYTKVTEPKLADIATYYEMTGYSEVLNFLRTGKAVAFAEQIEEVKNYEVQDGFETAQKGLYVYGGLLVRPKEIVCIRTTL